MAYHVFAVANAFIELSLRDNIPVTNMKLQKLVYIAQGFSFALLEQPLFDEDIRALKWGPVIMSLYNRVKHYGSNPIDKKIGLPEGMAEIELNGESSRESLIINFVWSRYKQYSAAQLSAITHKDGTPWSDVWTVNEYGVIPNDRISSHYKGIVNKKAA